MHFFAINDDVFRRVDTQTELVAFDTEHFQGDIVTDDPRFVGDGGTRPSWPGSLTDMTIRSISSTCERVFGRSQQRPVGGL